MRKFPSRVQWLALAVLAGAAGNGPAAVPQLAPSYRAEGVPPPAPAAAPSWGTRLLWYVPNRAMDLLDIVRLRLRLGPGLAVNFRMTDYGAFYIGKYNAIYAGLPGPRHPHAVRWPVGRESLRGVVMAGVDATDDTRHGPEYGVAESDLGVHLLLVGAEAGIDAGEFGDFLGGLVGRDFMGDDYPGPRPPAPEWSSGIAMGPGEGVFQVQPKPGTFTNFAARLDYLHLNVQQRVAEPIRATDAYFAVDPDAPVVPPQTQFRLGLYMTLKQGEDFELELKPDLEMDVELPNMEHRLRIFVESGQANELSQTTKADTDTQGFNVGARKYFKDNHVSLDAGVRARWLPELFVRVRWRPDWEFGAWGVRPEGRLFWESEDQFGALASEAVTRWLGSGEAYVLLQDASIKYTTGKAEYEWAGSAKIVRVPALLDERQRGDSLDWQDTARAQGIQGTVFGTDGTVDKYRASLGFRGPLYRKWIYWEVDPGLEWEEDDDYKTTFVLQIGLDLLFWGRAYE